MTQEIFSLGRSHRESVITNSIPIEVASSRLIGENKPVASLGIIQDLSVGASSRTQTISVNLTEFPTGVTSWKTVDDRRSIGTEHRVVLVANNTLSMIVVGTSFVSSLEVICLADRRCLVRLAI